MRLTNAQAAKLARLAVGESLPKSQIPKTILKSLKEADVVRFEKKGSSYVVRGIPQKLAAFVEHHWGVRDLGRYASATPENRNRETMAEIAGDSKALPSRPLDGIFLRSFGGCLLGEQSLGITPQGSASLVSLEELPRLQIHTRYIVSMENVRCLWHFEKARKHFPQLDNLEFTLVLRWHWSDAWRKWLGKWTGEMFHFPDYDPAGLSIFVTEVLAYRNDARLLIPKDFETLLNERGDRELYLRHEKYLNSLTEHREVAFVLESLKKSRKALEQESLLY